MTRAIGTPSSNRNRQPSRFASEADVLEAVQFAIDYGLTVTVRSGRHAYEPQYIADDSTSARVVIDVGELNAFSFAATPINAQGDTLATIQPGALLFDLVEAAWTYGLIVPGGTCPNVAYGGLSVSGGFGLASRMYGLTIDNVVAYRVAVACVPATPGTPEATNSSCVPLSVDTTVSAQIIEANATFNSDLFWALRGGGSDFGVVVAITALLHHIPTSTDIAPAYTRDHPDVPQLQPISIAAPAPATTAPASTSTPTPTPTLALKEQPTSLPGAALNGAGAMRVSALQEHNVTPLASLIDIAASAPARLSHPQRRRRTVGFGDVTADGRVFGCTAE